MVRVVGVRFRTAGKIYFFDPAALEIKKGDHIIVETVRGIEFGTVVGDIREVEDDKVVQPLKPVIRIANERDYEQEAANKEKEKEAFKICLEKIRKHGLNMKLIDAEYTFDNNKVLFYFTADGRIDFRELVKDLASVFKTRIELRQIGVRDETKTVGGIGICGRVLCCHSYLSDFIPVSIKMAKEQNLSLNPSKISGVCGRLMCCLKHEEDTYEELNRRLPGIGDYVTTDDGLKGEVQSVNVLRQLVKVVVEVGDEKEIREYGPDQLKFKKRHGKKDKAEAGSEEMSREELRELELLEKQEKAELTEKEGAQERQEKERRQDRPGRGERFDKKERFHNGEQNPNAAAGTTGSALAGTENNVAGVGVVAGLAAETVVNRIEAALVTEVGETATNVVNTESAGVSTENAADSVEHKENDGQEPNESDTVVERQNRWNRSYRQDRTDSYDRTERQNRSRTNRQDRNNGYGRADRQDRSNSYSRDNRQNRSDSYDGGSRQDRSSGYDRAERGDKYERNDRYNRQNRFNRQERYGTENTDRQEGSSRENWQSRPEAENQGNQTGWQEETSQTEKSSWQSRNTRPEQIGRNGWQDRTERQNRQDRRDRADRQKRYDRAQQGNREEAKIQENRPYRSNRPYRQNRYSGNGTGNGSGAGDKEAGNTASEVQKPRNNAHGEQNGEA
jgi:PSP1 domain protein